jgi:hypothetical protein
MGRIPFLKVPTNKNCDAERKEDMKYIALFVHDKKDVQTKETVLITLSKKTAIISTASHDDGGYSPSCGGVNIFHVLFSFLGELGWSRL